MASVPTLVGCSRGAAPIARVGTASVRERWEGRALIEVELVAENPRDVELPIREVAYEFRLDGKTVYRGTRQGLATISRRATQRVLLPVVVPDTSALDEAREFSLSGTLWYTTPSQLADVLFDAKISRPSVRFSGAGPVEPAGPTRNQ